ncbi:LysR substrate-binding domain-containing protein, partial [Burkholderia cenocepacia]|nr:LysR substrate-binding domain-containing protein [Burkholderia cenocepacia]
LPGMPDGPRVRLANLGAVPLILPSGPHGLRALLDVAFARTGFTPHIAAEVDGLAMLMDAVRGGLGATIQPGAALARLENAALAIRFGLVAAGGWPGATLREPPLHKN